jgi:hypothetical protein
VPAAEPGVPLVWSHCICALEPGFFECLYAGLVATRTLDTVVACLATVRAGTVAACLRDALVARANPTVADRKKPILRVAQAAAAAGLVPDIDLFYHPYGWAALLGSASFGGTALRALCCTRLVPSGPCLREQLCVRATTNVAVYAPVLGLSVNNKAGSQGFALTERVQVGLDELAAPNPRRPRCDCVWMVGDTVYECDAPTAPAERSGYVVAAIPPVLFLQAYAPAASGVLTSDRGCFVLRVAGQPYTYRVTGLVYLAGAHYNTYARFGDRWVVDQYDRFEDVAVDQGRIPLHRGEGASLQLLMAVRE